MGELLECYKSVAEKSSGMMSLLVLQVVVIIVLALKIRQMKGLDFLLSVVVLSFTLLGGIMAFCGINSVILDEIPNPLEASIVIVWVYAGVFGAVLTAFLATGRVKS